MSNTKKRSRASNGGNQLSSSLSPPVKKASGIIVEKNVIDTPTEIISVSSEIKNEISDNHPLSVGHRLVVRYRDGSLRLVKIIEAILNKETNAYQYYIHYLDFNRRMDEWIGEERILIYPSEANDINPHTSRYDIEKFLTDKSKGIPTNNKTKMLLTSNFDSNEQPIKIDPTTVAELDHDEHEGLDEASLIEHEEVTKVKNIKYVQLGKYIMECWYFSPFPKEFTPNGSIECIYFCEYSFRFFKTRDELIYYQNKSTLNRYPPGHEIYRDDHLSMFELDGAVEKIYCQNLSYFAKLFLDHKTLYWDVDPFLFYVLCTRDHRGYHPVGYFSKEKYSDMGYNLACILTFPCVQRKGYGKFLITFSYELSKKEGKIGSPEKPLSDLGAVGYRSYWAATLINVLRNLTGSHITLFQLMKLTSFAADDIVSTLEYLGLLKKFTQDDQIQPVIHAPHALLDELILKYPEPMLKMDPERLHWAPLYVTDYKKDRWCLKAKRETKKGNQISSSATIDTFTTPTPTAQISSGPNEGT